MMLPEYALVLLEAAEAAEGVDLAYLGEALRAFRAAPSGLGEEGYDASELAVACREALRVPRVREQLSARHRLRRAADLLEDACIVCSTVEGLAMMLDLMAQEGQRVLREPKPQ